LYAALKGDTYASPTITAMIAGLKGNRTFVTHQGMANMIYRMDPSPVKRGVNIPALNI
jgi:hypothetical protein